MPSQSFLRKIELHALQVRRNYFFINFSIWEEIAALSGCWWWTVIKLGQSGSDTLTNSTVRVEKVSLVLFWRKTFYTFLWSLQGVEFDTWKRDVGWSITSAVTFDTTAANVHTSPWPPPSCLQKELYIIPTPALRGWTQSGHVEITKLLSWALTS